MYLYDEIYSAVIMLSSVLAVSLVCYGFREVHRAQGTIYLSTSLSIQFKVALLA